MGADVLRSAEGMDAPCHAAQARLPPPVHLRHPAQYIASFFRDQSQAHMK